MADPFGANFSAEDAKLAEMADPNLNFVKIAQRVRQLRVDLDAVNADAASTSAVLAALAAADANVDVNRQDIRNAKDIVSHASENLVLNTANEMKIQTANTDRIRILANGNIGFLGATPVAQQTDCGTGGDAAANATSIGLIRDCLRNLGLMA